MPFPFTEISILSLQHNKRRAHILAAPSSLHTCWSIPVLYKPLFQVCKYCPQQWEPRAMRTLLPRPEGLSLLLESVTFVLACTSAPKPALTTNNTAHDRISVSPLLQGAGSSGIEKCKKKICICLWYILRNYKLQTNIKQWRRWNA